MANPHAMAYQFAGKEKREKNNTQAKGVLISEGDIIKPHFLVMIFGIIDKPKNIFVFFHNKNTSINFQ